MAEQNGTSGNDVIYGTTGDDVQNGGEGNDSLRGGAGNDDLYGGEGNDALQGGAGQDDLYGGVGNDTYFIEDNQDSVFELGGEGIDTVVSYLAEYRLGANLEILKLFGPNAIAGAGNELDNSIQGNSNNNRLDGRGGDDSIYGFDGNDVMNGGAGNDLMVGGSGTDTVSYRDATGGVTVDLRINNRPQDTVSAGLDSIRDVENIEGSDNFGDTLTGNAGANQIVGRGGDDALRGFGGDDDLTGGSGDDSFEFEAAGTANGVDRIRSFEAGDTLLFESADGYDSGSTFTVGNQVTAANAAQGAGPQFIFDEGRDALYYDDDGAGGADAILIAFIDGFNVQANQVLIDGTPIGGVAV